jgi:hypothetical protein
VTEATFESRCPVYDQTIHEGEPIAANQDDEFCHRQCVEEEE